LEADLSYLSNVAMTLDVDFDRGIGGELEEWRKKADEQSRKR